MAVDPTSINNTISTAIVTNREGRITAGVLMSVLLAIVAWVVANFAPMSSVALFNTSQF